MGDDMADISLEDGQPDKVPHLPTWKLLLVTLVVGGVQVGWALQLSLLTPFVQDLGVPASMSLLIWICGPMSGLVVQPLVGWYSDYSRHKWGRRRPFIVGGAVFVIFSMILISNASDIGHAMGDPQAPYVPDVCLNIDTNNPHEEVEHKAKPWAIFFFVTGFWILDVANNMMQGPCRALISDIAAPEQQYAGMAFVSLWIGVGNVAGYTMGFVNWTKYFKFMIDAGCNDNCANLRTAFCLAMILLCICTAISCYIAKEKPYTGPPASGNNPLVEVFKACKSLDNPMRWVCLVFFCNWVALYPQFTLQTDWFGRSIYGGDPSSTDISTKCAYNAGVRQGSLGLVFNSIVALIASFILPRIVNHKAIGPRRMWAAGLVFYGILMLGTTVTKTTGGALTLFALLGIPWAVTLVVPFGVVGMMAGDRSAGLLMGVLNIACVSGQLVVTAFHPLFVRIPGVVEMGDSASFLSGGIVAFIAAVLSFRIPVPQGSHDDAAPMIVSDQIGDSEL